MKYLDLLSRNPAYARLWLAQAISLAGDWFSFIAISALIARLTGSAGLAISLSLLCREVPRVLLSPIAGVLLDRFDRRTLLIGSDLARVPIVLAFLLVQQPEHLPLAYVLIVLQFSLSALFEPGRNAILPAAIRDERDLIDANILGSITWSVMLAVGGALGGFAAALVGTTFAFVVDALSFLVSGLIILSVRDLRRDLRNVTRVESKPTPRVGLSDLADGLRYARQRPPVFAALFIKAGGGIGSIDTFIILYATTLFIVGQDGSGTLGLFWSVFGFGAVVGPLIADRLSNGTVRHMRRSVVVAYAVITLGWLGFGAAPTLLFAAAAIFIKAMGGSIYWTYSSVIIQKQVDDAYLGRMFAFDFALFELMQTCSILITGIAIEALTAANPASVPGDHARIGLFATALVSLVPVVASAIIVPRLERWEAKHRPMVVADAVPEPAGALPLASPSPVPPVG